MTMDLYAHLIDHNLKAAAKVSGAPRGHRPISRRNDETSTRDASGA
jgi:hypothetical protein